MEVAYVLERLREMANKRFDPAVIEALVRSHEKGDLVGTVVPSAEAPTVLRAGAGSLAR
jgi:HD-GYP domain-containing protein (c-di-GMP phosphodiesterase class II)